MNMTKLSIQTLEYYVGGLGGFTLNEALRYWKAKFETIKHFKRDVIKHTALAELGEFVAEVWDSIKPITVSEAFGEQNMEKRRVMFDCIGVARLFKELEPELLNQQVVSKSRTRWNTQNTAYEHNYDDTYELYRIDGDKLFKPLNEWNKPNPVYAVRCWCTTTEREYWIYVPEEIALGARSWQHELHDPDAIRAIAWTIRLDINKPRRIYRQGDIIVAEESEDSQTVAPYHLTKEQYLTLMFSET